MRFFYYISSVLLSCLFVLFAVDTAIGCTSFMLKTDDSVLVGKSEAFDSGEILLIVNKRGVSKRALLFARMKPAEWVSKFGSLSFNLLGSDMPIGGMNEAGLVVDALWMKSTAYPEPGEKTAVNELQFIQLLLDTCASVENAAAAAKNYTIASIKAPIHYFLADSSGETGVIYFKDGEVFCITGDEMNVPVLTNEIYEDSVKYLKNFQHYSGKEFLPISMDRLDRFARTAINIDRFKDLKSIPAFAYAWDILSSVQQKKWQYSAVYDLKARAIHFHSRRDWNMKKISIDALNYECSAPMQYFDINSSFEGDIADKFQPATEEVYRGQVEKVIRDVPFMRNFPAKLVQAIVQYPKSFHCQ
ncbi:MAG: linear amide C-N hydrolase [Acidobacteria bacterium]|nr:linear amide C-N hydrolase [Acidobacteriota bacterium]